MSLTVKSPIIKSPFFLAVQNSSIGDLVTDSLTDHSLTHLLILTLNSDPRELWPLRLLIRVMRRHDLTQKKPTHQHTYLPTYLCTSIREHPKGVILGTWDLLDIWSDWWGDMTWPKKTQPTHLPTYISTYLPTYLTQQPTYLPTYLPTLLSYLTTYLPTHLTQQHTYPLTLLSNLFT